MCNIRDRVVFSPFLRLLHSNKHLLLMLIGCADLCAGQQLQWPTVFMARKKRLKSNNSRLINFDQCQWFQILSEPRRSFLLALSYQGRKSQKSPAQAIVEGGRLIKGKQEISAITTWRKNIHKMSFKMPCHRYYRLSQTGVWRSRREVLAVGSGQRPSNSSIMDQSRHLTRSLQCSASTPLPLKRGKTE